MGPLQHRELRACLIVAHNLGDAVIQSVFLQQLVARDYAKEYLVWTRPQVAFLFESIPHCDVICSQFPVGTSKQMDGWALLAFICAALRVRNKRPSVTIDLIGDIRDRLFARMVGTPRHLHIGWAVGHPFRQLIRNPFGDGAPFVRVPAEVRNVYAAHDVMLRKLAPQVQPTAQLSRSTSHAIELTSPIRVGLHPFASQICKLWPSQNWQALTESLLASNAEVTAFGAPDDLIRLQDLFGQFKGRVRLVTDDLPHFSDHVSTLNVMVGLDSFSVHMAYRQGVRTVMISAGNPPDLWSPPLCTTIASSGGCTSYPCYNVPKCKGTDGEYACIKAVTPRQVFDAVHNCPVDQ